VLTPSEVCQDGQMSTANTSANTTANTNLDVAALRAETPGCHDLAFLNSAGSSLPTRRTLDAVSAHLELEGKIGGYAAADAATDTIRSASQGLARLIGGRAHEVALAVSDSDAWVRAIWGWMLGRNVSSSQVVLADRLSYHSHHAALVQLAELFGFELRTIASLDDGTVDLTAMSTQLADDRIALVSVTAIGTHSGNVNPMLGIGRLVSARGVPLFVDGCQALGHLEVDVRKWGCSVFTGTGRKWLRAPRGTGMLWVAEELVDRFAPPGIDGVSTSWTSTAGFTMAKGMQRFESFEGPIAARVGLASAVDDALALNRHDVAAHIAITADQFRADLACNPRVTVHDTAAHRSGIVTFSVSGATPSSVVAAAAERGVSINVSTATWAALDMDAKGLSQVVRVSPHIFNTANELERVIDAVDELPDGNLAPVP
jgi:cysteine desulfurase / selenocysteine lyase